MSNACLDRAAVNRHAEPYIRPSLKTASARILIADHHPLVRDGLSRVISEQANWNCCAEAGTVVEAQTLVARHQPDLVIMEITLKGGDGLELVKKLKAESPGLCIMIFSQRIGRMYVELALRAGAQGYLSKEHAAPEVVHAIRTVLAGEVYLARSMAALLLHRFVGVSEHAAPGGGDRLTGRELQVFQLLGAGRSTREIASDLNRSFKTVESHRENIKRKLQLRGSELVSNAMQWAGEAMSLSGPVEFRSPSGKGCRLALSEDELVPNKRP